jgi:hypothetical protein
MLKPQDIVVSLKLLQSRDGGPVPTYASLAMALKLSSSEVHAAVGRCLEVGLLRKPADSARTMPQPVRAALEEFLLHGMKYVWPARRGPMTRGFPTGSSLESVSRLLNLTEPTIPLVWPHPAGTVRGESVDPLYPRTVEACEGDPILHEWLALLDILRLKTGREAALAGTAIHNRLA